MSASNEWTEYHLTRKGWMAGSSKFDFGPENVVTPPVDRVLTCRYREKVSSPFSSMEQCTQEVWRCGDDAAIASLRERFGDCPTATL